MSPLVIFKTTPSSASGSVLSFLSQGTSCATNSPVGHQPGVLRHPIPSFVPDVQASMPSFVSSKFIFNFSSIFQLIVRTVVGVENTLQLLSRFYAQQPETIFAAFGGSIILI